MVRVKAMEDKEIPHFVYVGEEGEEVHSTGGPHYPRVTAVVDKGIVENECNNCGYGRAKCTKRDQESDEETFYPLKITYQMWCCWCDNHTEIEVDKSDGSVSEKKFENESDVGHEMRKGIDRL